MSMKVLCSPLSLHVIHPAEDAGGYKMEAAHPSLWSEIT